jgi:hypothetical protein
VAKAHARSGALANASFVELTIHGKSPAFFANTKPSAAADMDEESIRI